MKRKKSCDFLKSLSIASIALIISVLCFLFTGNNEVQAEEGQEYGTLNTSISEDYAVADYEGSVVKKYIEQEAPVVDDYLFAGWFTEEECTLKQSVRKASAIQDGTTYYAKFIPEDVLSVKAQVSDRDVNLSQEGNQRNMRFVSSVDSLNYSKIGFILQYEENGEWVTKSNTSNTVYTRIKSASFGDEYLFSPKVVDAHSEYFITATWKGATNEGVFENDFETGLYVRAYWVTLDGVQVFGESRYVSVSDGLNQSVLNVPIKNSTLVAEDSVTATYGEGESAVSFTGTVAYVDGTYAHVKFNMGAAKRTSLDSATAFTIQDSESATLATEVYRNYYKNDDEAIGVDYADDSWYTQRDDGQKEFVIATVDDLYGLAKVVNSGTKFQNNTIYLVSDVTINDMTVAEMQTALNDENIDDPVTWNSIGTNNTLYFSGTFDGQGHNIKGLYTTQNGLFGWALDATLQKFSLKDSYISTANNAGSIVNTFDGTMDTVYSNATIYSESNVVGGLIGRTTNENKVALYDDSEFTVTNSWYAGDITLVNSKKNLYCGGLVGYIVKGIADDSHVISHSLHTGNIVISNSSSTYKINAGGLVGAPNGTAIPLVLSDCLVAGNYSVTEDTKATLNVGSVVGLNGSVTSITEDTYVYAISEWNDNTVLGASAATKANIVIPESNYDNYQSYNTMPNLDYYKSSNTDGYWVVRENAVPALKSFADEWIDVAWYYDNNSAGGDTFTITTKEQLYGLAELSQDNTFSNETIQLGKDIKLNQGTIDKELYTDEEWEVFVAGLRKWQPIGWFKKTDNHKAFAGVFNGQNHTISGIYMEAGEDYSGLFAATDDGSEVRNLKLTNSYFKGTYNIMGSIAGQGAGTFDTIYSDAIVESNKQQIGGIFGRVNKVSSSKHTINNCWFDGRVTLAYDTDAKVYGGAIAGAFVQGTLDITNCLNTGSVTHVSATDLTSNTNYYVGGMCGGVMNASVLQISNCLNAGALTAVLENGTQDTQKIVSAAVGYVNNGDSTKKTTINRFFYITECCNSLIKQPSGKNYITFNGSKGVESIDDITGKISYIHSIDNKNNKLDFYTSSNPEGAWVVTENSIPALKSFTDEWIDVAWYYDTKDYDGGSNSFDISTAEEFFGFSVISQEYTFENDTVNLCKNVVLDKVAGREWTPIGTQSNVFQGVFDGNRKTISGINVTRNDSSDYVGLFGWTADATIKNFVLSDSTFRGTANAMGAIVGNGDGTIANIFCDNTVSLETTSTTTIGGMFGRVQDPLQTNNADYIANTLLTVTNCWFEGTIEQSNNISKVTTTIGGIVGLLAHGRVNIDNALFTGKLDCSKTIASKDLYVGGILGKPNEYTTTNVTIKNTLCNGSEIEATVTGCNGYVGIIAGLRQSNEKDIFENIYAISESGINAAGQLKNSATQPVSSIQAETMYNTIAELDTSYWMEQETNIPVLKSLNDKIDKSVEWFYDYAGNESDPYTISNVDDLESFGTFVNTGTTFADKVVKLANDITVNEGEINPNMYNTTEEWERVTKKLNIWTPIGTVSGDKIENAFQGTFDGNDHTISGLYVESDDQYLGLFRKIKDATICNLRIKNSYINSLVTPGSISNVGSVAGGGDGTIENVYSNARLCGSRIIGGIIGRVSENNKTDTKMNITSCWYEGIIDSDYTGNGTILLGGLVGFAAHGTTTVNTCLYTGDIDFDVTYNGTSEKYGPRVGGIAGADNGTAASIVVGNCMTVGNIDASLEPADTNSTTPAFTQIGSVIGQKGSSNSSVNDVCSVSKMTKVDGTDTTTIEDSYAFSYGTIENLYGLGADVLTSLTFDSADEATPVWAARLGQLPAPAVFVDDALDSTRVGKYDTTWYADDKMEEGAYIIDSVEDFYGFAVLSQQEDGDFENETIKLNADLTLSNNATADEWASGTPGDLPWLNIGKTRFAGTFDGKNHSISGVYMKQDIDYMGLFANTAKGSEIKNFNIVNSYFCNTVDNNSTSRFVGSVVADLRGNMSNVYSNAIIHSNNIQVGGLIARANGVNASTIKIDNAWFDGEICTGKNSTVCGGIVATVVQGTLDLNNALFTGKIVNQYEGTDVVHAGGLVGETQLNPVKLLIDSAISAGTIEGKHTYNKVGAIVGNIGNEVKNSGKDDALALNPELELKDVFATRECFGIPYFTDGKKTGTLLTADGDKQSIESKITVTNQVIWVQNADRLIGYCQEDVNPEAGYVGGSLDFTSDSPAWIMREQGTPVPAVFEELLNPIYNTQKVSVDDLNKAIGLDKWTDFDATASVSNALHYGVGKYVVTFGSSEIDSKSTYEAYVAHLTKSVDEGGLGFTTYVSNTLDEVYDTIYTKEDGDWVLNVLYTEHTGVTTITIRTGIDEVLSPNLRSENVTQEGEENITLSMLTLLGAEEKEEIFGVEKRLYYYGNSFVFQLPNKHFIISDGGSKEDLVGLIEYLKKLVGTEDDGTQKKVVIDAWIASHQHGDHFGVMMGFYHNPSLVKDISVEAIYINEPNNRTLDFIYYSDSKQAYDKVNDSAQSQYRGMHMLKTSSDKMTPVYSYQTGERYYFNGMTMDVIQSQEQIPVENYAEKRKGKNLGTDFNTASSVVLFTTKNGEKILIGGDANYKNMDYIMATYGDNPETLDGIDVFTAWHHGKNTSHNISTVDNVFTNYLTDNGVNKFEVVLYPCEKLYGVDSLTDFDAFPAAGGANNHLINNHISSTGKHYVYGKDTSTVILVEFGDTITHGEVSIAK